MGVEVDLWIGNVKGIERLCWPDAGWLPLEECDRPVRAVDAWYGGKAHLSRCAGWPRARVSQRQARRGRAGVTAVVVK